MPGAPRAPNGKKKEAEKLFNKGMKLTDIAKKLEVPEGTVRSWKNRGKWGGKPPRKDECSVADDDAESNATLQKRKRGGQPENKNSAGHAPSVPKRNKNAEKHGAFSKLYFADITEDEWELISCMEDNEEMLMILGLQLFSVRERRFMNDIKKFREMEAENHGLSVEGVSKTKKVEDLTDAGSESIEPGKYKKVTETTVTHTKAVMSSILALETELTRMQKAKEKEIEALGRLRLEKQKLEGDAKENEGVKAWVDRIIQMRDSQNEQ